MLLIFIYSTMALVMSSSVTLSYHFNIFLFPNHHDWLSISLLPMLIYNLACWLSISARELECTFQRPFPSWQKQLWNSLLVTVGRTASLSKGPHPVQNIGHYPWEQTTNTLHISIILEPIWPLQNCIPGQDTVEFTCTMHRPTHTTPFSIRNGLKLLAIFQFVR